MSRKLLETGVELILFLVTPKMSTKCLDSLNNTTLKMSSLTLGTLNIEYKVCKVSMNFVQRDMK